MEAKEIYLKIKREITKGLYAYNDQIAAISKWIESEFDYRPEKQNERLLKAKVTYVSQQGVVEIKNFKGLEDLLKWREKLDEKIIIDGVDFLLPCEDKGENFDFLIEVYDDYRE